MRLTRGAAAHPVDPPLSTINGTKFTSLGGYLRKIHTPELFRAMEMPIVCL